MAIACNASECQEGWNAAESTLVIEMVYLSKDSQPVFQVLTGPSVGSYLERTQHANH